MQRVVLKRKMRNLHPMYMRELRCDYCCHIISQGPVHLIECPVRISLLKFLVFIRNQPFDNARAGKDDFTRMPVSDDRLLFYERAEVDQIPIRILGFISGKGQEIHLTCRKHCTCRILPVFPWERHKDVLHIQLDFRGERVVVKAKTHEMVTHK